VMHDLEVVNMFGHLPPTHHTHHTTPHHTTNACYRRPLRALDMMWRVQLAQLRQQCGATYVKAGIMKSLDSVADGDFAQNVQLALRLNLEGWTVHGCVYGDNM